MTAKMTMRERMTAMIQGKPHDRVPFVQYSDLGAPDREAWNLVGEENLGVLHWIRLCRLDRPNCQTQIEEITRGDGLEATHTTIVTPEGTLTEVRHVDPSLHTRVIDKRFVTEPDDYVALRALLRDTHMIDVHDAVDHAFDDIGDHGLPHAMTPRTPFQQLWIEWVSLEDLCFHLVDCREIVEECMELMADLFRKSFTAARSAKVPYVVVPDNITAPAIGMPHFKRYCLPLYAELASQIVDHGKLVFVHMDGHLKSLTEAIRDSEIGGIDSFSPLPDNDMTLAEAVDAWPGMRLATNFPSSIQMQDEAAVYEHACRMLDVGGKTGRLQIQISEDPPADTWRTTYPAIVRAIEDFGEPA